MTINDIFNLEFPTEFGSDEYNNETESIEDVYAQLDNSVSTAYGASKFVIFLNDREVIKIPFNGSFYEDEEKEDFFFEKFITPDYCKLEAEIYQKAVDAGVGYFFASTEYVGAAFDSTPIYISERVRCFNDVTIPMLPVQPSEDSREKAVNLRTEFNLAWLSRAIECYGIENVVSFLDFINKENINDFHNANLGFRYDGSPVVLDYSGFWE